ncbi:MAG: EAL domain-containing protein [Candidatus Thiodiazotropha sp.]
MDSGDNNRAPPGVRGRLLNTLAGGASVASITPGFFRWFALLIIVIVIVTAMIIRSDLSHRDQIQQSRVLNQTHLASQSVRITFDSVLSDLKYLAGATSVRRFSDRLPGARQELAGDLIALSAQKRWYDQIRYLDLSGKELVRVDLRDGLAHQVAESSLQDKSSRYYFRETERLGPGEVFVSPLDLNIEHGIIEQPIKPMLRFGTVVFDSEGRKQGILLLNFLAARLLEIFRDANDDPATQLYLLNAGGYWLSSPEAEDSWGFMYPQKADRTFGNRYPQTWRQLLKQQSGRSLESGYHFTFQKLDPLSEYFAVSNTPAAGDPTVTASGYHWYVVGRHLEPTVGNLLLEPTTLSPLLLSLLMAALSAWFVARSIHQEQSLVELRINAATRKAQETIRTLSLAVEQSPVSVVITDPHANIEYVNRGFEQVTGYTSAEVIGKNPRILKSGEVPEKTYREMWKTISIGDSWRGEFRNRRKDGSLYWEQAFISPVKDDAGVIRHFLAVKDDISLEKSHEEMILHQAHYDFLTNLPNRFLALDRLEQLLKASSRTQQQIALLFLDIDDFKKVNDTLGHDVGDELLIQASERLVATIRRQDTVARLGGDEFLVILGGVNPDAASVVAKHIVESFREPFFLDDQELAMTLSIGIAVYPQDGSSVKNLLRNADIAMYRSKQEGRNTYSYFTESMNREMLRSISIEARLRGAIARDDLTLHYQPIVSLEDGMLIGAEALLRWHDAELGKISPDEFIPVAERSNLISEIGWDVLVKAMAQLVPFRQRYGEGFYISVNVSPPQFHDELLAQRIEAELQARGLPGSALTLEITEGVLLKGDPRVTATLGKLSNSGVRLSMDDFGTGYSSLSYLRRYPFDVLKVDREFIRDLVDDPNDRELVRATIHMAQALGLKVVAEGIELAEQREMLLGWRCDLGQGYLFGKPVDAEEFLSSTVANRR